MEFSSLVFLFRFMPVVFLYYLLPDRFKNPLLLIASVVFYAFGEPFYIFLILISVSGNYLAVRVMDCIEGEKKKKIWLGALVFINVGVLLFFKYTPYTMPLGMSFYTFTVLSYILDVYFGHAPAEQSFVDAGVYMMMFPKMISGPIARYGAVRKQIKEHTVSLSDMEAGAAVFIVGFGFKMVLADHFGMLWHDIRSAGFDSISTALAWLGVAGYSAQLFFDFQGYSLMAIGIGRMFGYRLPQNFNHPYRAKSVGEYYRRWHITLGEWFKHYLYIPLGGNRKGASRTMFNLFVVWLVTGIWHGATVNFLIWGMALFLLIAGEKLVWGKFLEKNQAISRLYILLLIPLTWIVFAIDNIKDLGVYFTRLFPFWGSASYVNPMDFTRHLKNHTIFFIMAFLVSLPVTVKLCRRYRDSKVCKAVLFVLFVFCLYEAACGANNPFLYFRF